MREPHRREVSVIERRDRFGAVSLREHHDGGVDNPQGKIDVTLGELGDPRPLGIEDWLDDQLAIRDRFRECDFGVGPDSCLQEVRDLGDHECGDEERDRVS